MRAGRVLVPALIGIILNLKPLNEFILDEHFKMEHIEFVKEVLQQSDWLGSIDLADAYFSIPIHRSHWKYLRFFWNGELFCYKVLVFGLSSAPRIFTQLCKPILARLRGYFGIICSMYIDDLIIMAQSHSAAISHLVIAKNQFLRLGFNINKEKSLFFLNQKIVHLGFLINSLSLTLFYRQTSVQVWRTSARTQLQKENVVQLDLQLASLIF